MKVESNWLVSSRTVSSIQRYFGLQSIEEPPSSLTKGVNQSLATREHININDGVHDRHQSPKTKINSESATNEMPRYTVNNWFWYYLFGFGSSLGDDIFYFAFYPFWFYNLSPWVIRRVILVWGFVMYVGQSCKEILRWPRPSKPAVRIEGRYFKEFGMPSTHAMSGTLVPFTILAVTWDHYEVSFRCRQHMPCLGHWCPLQYLLSRGTIMR